MQKRRIKGIAMLLTGYGWIALVVWSWRDLKTKYPADFPSETWPEVILILSALWQMLIISLIPKHRRPYSLPGPITAISTSLGGALGLAISLLKHLSSPATVLCLHVGLLAGTICGCVLEFIILKVKQTLGL